MLRFMSMQENQKPSQKMEVGLSLGSNIGDRLQYLRAAAGAIQALSEIQITGLSPIYETEPVGVKPEYRDMSYLNAVVILETSLAAHVVSGLIHDIEERLGREREGDRFAPRTIDIDILYAGCSISDDPELTLPHPRWAQRRFVLQPLCDLRPDLQIPGSGRTVREHLAALPPGAEAVLKLPDLLSPAPNGNPPPRRATDYRIE
jgi:2-amino-4-hydroxy-6-hydroxymethyldihydropteridine diphosphokinase